MQDVKNATLRAKDPSNFDVMFNGRQQSDFNGKDFVRRVVPHRLQHAPCERNMIIRISDKKTSGSYLTSQIYCRVSEEERTFHTREIKLDKLFSNEVTGIERKLSGMSDGLDRNDI